jgi:hypothetical protein
MHKKKKAQMFVMDLAVGIAIFVTILVIFYRAEINIQEIDARELSDLTIEASLISDALHSKGYPEDWTNATVLEAGITEDSRIDESKLEMLKDMDYMRTRELLRTKYDYYFYFENDGASTWIEPGVQEGIGKPGVTSLSILAGENPKKLVRITRFVIYKSEPHRMIIYVWKT